jgi:PAS domain S-box-containing protein
MADEEKTRAQLIAELRVVRSELVELKLALMEQDLQHREQMRQEPAAEFEKESSELVWSLRQENPPMLEDPRDDDEPRFLDPLKSAEKVSSSGGVTPTTVTETGSYDMRWTTLISFQRLLDAIPTPVLLLDRSGAVHFANHAFRIMGKDRQWEQRPLDALFSHAHDRHHVTGLMANVLSERRPQAWEGLLVIEGREIWGRMNLRSIRFGRERGILALIEDLTPQKMEALTNEKYKKLVNLFPLGIAEFVPAKPISVDVAPEAILPSIIGARATEGNSEFIRMVGPDSLEQMQGVSLDKILASQPVDLQFYREWIGRQFAPGSFETKERNSEGDLRHYEVTLVGNVRDGFLVQFWAVKRDITDRKRAQEELTMKLKTIDELYAHIVQIGKAKAITEHTANVAHELRQPLAIIGGLIRRLARQSEKERESPPTGEMSRAATFQIITNEISRLENILGGLIDFTRHETVKFQKLNPNDLIEYVLHVNEGRILDKGLKVKINLSQEVGEIPLDPDRFQHVIRNLLANAIEASPYEGAITIETGFAIPSEKAHETGELTTEVYFEIKVHSESLISPDDLDKIFNPFFTSKRYGTGLGLTLARRIVEDHQGSISVKSDPETGTLMTVWLPVK